MDWLDVGQGLMLTMAKAVGRSGSPGRRKGPLTSVEKAHLDTEKEPRVLGDGGVYSPLPVPRVSIGKMYISRSILQSQVVYHYFPQIHYPFPLVGLLALNSLALWWVNFVLMFINALLTFPQVTFWLVIRLSVCAIVRHCCSKPSLRKTNFIPLGNRNYL